MAAAAAGKLDNSNKAARPSEAHRLADQEVAQKVVAALAADTPQNLAVA